MLNMTEIDPNFKVEANIDRESMTFYDVQKPPFSVHGVFYENGKFRRMTEAVAQTVSKSVYSLHSQTAGGRVRFKTDSARVAIHADMSMVRRLPHFALTGSAGFDMYARIDGEDRFVKNFVPPIDVINGYESLHDFGTAELREITIHMPLFSEISDLYIGVDKDAKLYPAEPYRNDKPIVYYGSSITQGACASRPGNCYENIVSRVLHVDHVNLGFSGSAKAEPEIAEYIKNLDMSIFVYDYDHNAKTPEDLERTHDVMFQTIRQAHPDLPILIMPRPRYSPSEREARRHAIILDTYQRAKESGDENVYFIPGKELMALAGNDGTVDANHPNDLGFASMAKPVAKMLAQILDKMNI